MSISDAAADRIAKLVTRLGDDNENEIVAAARLICATLRSAGRDLHDLARLISSDRQFTVEDITRAMKARSERQRAKKRAQAKPRTRHTKRKADELTWWRDHVTQLLASDWLVDIEREVVTHVLEWLRLGGLPKGNVKLTIRALLAAKARRDLEVRRRKKGADDDALRV